MKRRLPIGYALAVLFIGFDVAGIVWIARHLVLGGSPW